MAIEFKCPHCPAELSAKDEGAGKTAKCPKCGKEIKIPEAGENQQQTQN